MIIGIDPDITKSGFAILNHGALTLKTLTFPEVLEALLPNITSIKAVYIEAGWLNKKASWHMATSMAMASNIGMKVGQNQAVGKLLLECITRMGIKVIEVRPTTKKLNAEDFRRLTKYEGSTNQENRDAAMLIFGR